MTTTASGDDGSSTGILTRADTWLSQGDVFASVPILHMEVDQRGQLAARILDGPAVLLTNDCALDKRSARATLPRIPTLHFTRLQSILNQGRDRQLMLRQRAVELDPSEVMYLGHVGTFGESYVDLSQIYGLPSRKFSLSLRPVEDAQPGDLRLTLDSGDNRLGSMTEDAVRLLRRKIIKYWTRLVEFS